MITSLTIKKADNVTSIGDNTWGYMDHADILKLAYNLLVFGAKKESLTIFHIYGAFGERFVSQKAFEGVMETIMDLDDGGFSKHMSNSAIFVANRFINENDVNTYGEYNFNNLQSDFSEEFASQGGEPFYNLCTFIAFNMLISNSVREMVIEEYEDVFQDCFNHFLHKWVSSCIERVGGHGAICNCLVHDRKWGSNSMWQRNMIGFLIDNKEFRFIHTKDMRGAIRLPCRRAIAVAGGLYISDWLKLGQEMGIPLPD